MAVVKPFRGYFYSSEFIKSHPIERLAAPPYDVISEKEKVRLEEEPYNFVHLTLGKEGNSYQKAKELLQSWVKEGVVEQDKTPSFYIFFIIFCVSILRNIKYFLICFLRLYFA